MSENSKLEASRFLVNEQPFCVWDWGLRERNLDFLSSMKPSYFRFMAEMIASQFNDDTSQEAALSARTLYGHALESFIALVGASVQAPDCIPGWLLKYHQKDLEDIAAKVSRGIGLPTKLKLERLDWNHLSEAVLTFVKFESDEKRSKVINGFATAWSRLASDFCNKRSYVEYNSIKHGFRVSLGGFSLAFGVEPEFGVPPPREQMHSLGGSKYGTSFLMPEKLASSKNHFRLRRVSRNWVPENFVSRVVLIEMSMCNIIGFLRVINGVDPKIVKFSWPADLQMFDQLWEGRVGVPDFDMDIVVETSDIIFFSDDEIRAVYRKDTTSDA